MWSKTLFPWSKFPMPRRQNGSASPNKLVAAAEAVVDRTAKWQRCRRVLFTRGPYRELVCVCAVCRKREVQCGVVAVYSVYCMPFSFSSIFFFYLLLRDCPSCDSEQLSPLAFLFASCLISDILSFWGENSELARQTP